MFSWIQQVVTVSLFNLKNLPARLGSSVSTVLGVAGVVLVFIGVLSIGVGFSSTLSQTGDPESVIVMRSGTNSEMSSGLGLDETKLIAQAPGIATGESGSLASAELFVIVDVPKRSTGTSANVPLRGVSPQAFEVRGDFEITEGRAFEPGKNEVIVGRGAAAEFTGLDVGSSLEWGQNRWTVVGIFDTGGTVEDSEIWTDAKVLQPAYRRGSSYQSVHLRLADAAAFDDLKSALTEDPQLNVMVERKADWFASQGSALSGTIYVVGGIIGLLMGFGAVFGALNTMYTAVSARTREIATLRALGFGTMPVVASVLLEAMVLAALGGVLGAVVAFIAFNGFQASTLNFQSFSQVTFAFAVTPPLMISGLIYALIMGFFGGLFPAWRAARLPVSTALREVA
ncbi:MAG: ABC transporter permease [Thermoanaerobaculia bacterium]|nr:ABC transporter permease [Thermoanaerobaculia bacterium]